MGYELSITMRIAIFSKIAKMKIKNSDTEFRENFMLFQYQIEAVTQWQIDNCCLFTFPDQKDWYVTFRCYYSPGPGTLHHCNAMQCIHFKVSLFYLLLYLSDLSLNEHSCTVYMHKTTMRSSHCIAHIDFKYAVCVQTSTHHSLVQL